MNAWIYFSIAIAIYPLLFWLMIEELEDGDPADGAFFLLVPFVWPLLLAVLAISGFIVALQWLAGKVARYKRSRRGSL